MANNDGLKGNNRESILVKANKLWVERGRSESVMAERYGECFL